MPKYVESKVSATVIHDMASVKMEGNMVVTI